MHLNPKIFTIAAAIALAGWTQHAVASPTPPGFTEAYDITVQPNNTATIAIHGAGTPLDPGNGDDDFLISVFNNGTSKLLGLTLTGSDIFGFDGDGIGNILAGLATPGTPFGPTGYEGPDNSFSVVDNNNGSVLFAGLLPGQSTYFSLEGIPEISAWQLANIASAPLPSTLPLLAAALAGFAGLTMWRRRRLASAV